MRLSLRKRHAEPHLSPPSDFGQSQPGTGTPGPKGWPDGQGARTYNASIMLQGSCKRCPEVSSCLCGDRAPAQVLVPGCWAGRRAVWSVAEVECSGLGQRGWVRGLQTEPPTVPLPAPVRGPR